MNCPSNPETGTDHCWHEYQRHTTRSAGGPGAANYGDMSKVEQCCYCPAFQTIHHRLERPQGHGPNAPMVWVLTK